MKPRIRFLTLGVADLAASTRFYRDGLGLPLADQKDDIVVFDLEGFQLALYGAAALALDANVPAEGTGFRGFAVAHNVASKEQVLEIIERARTAGAKITKEPQDVFWGGYSGYFADPDGFLWEIAWNPADFAVE